jgi:protein SHQ1
MVLNDVINLLKKGKKAILKILLEIRRTFIDGENRYILNDLYINDYCVWIQYARFL